MATYVISDLHGALTEFKALLKKIDFHTDGSDALYLLGDYADWGKQSIETLLYVMETDRQYPFVHCLMGNHEQMFLWTAESGYHTGEDADDNTLNWLFGNHGHVTWEGYEKLPEEKQQELVRWMKGLRLSETVEAGGKTFLLAHAYPYFYDTATQDAHTEGNKMMDALWRRLMIREDPFARYTGKTRYDMFVCGHTITNYYYQKLRFEKNWPTRKPAESVRNRIFFGERFIVIDCGAKCIGMEFDAHDVIRVAALRAQLACLRLEDLKGFYCHRPMVRMPEGVHMPEGVRIPDLKLPDIKDIKIPEVKLPEVKLPDWKQKK